MACGRCGGAAARSTDKWIYQAPDGTVTEYSSKVEADIQVTRNGGGDVRKKQ